MIHSSRHERFKWFWIHYRFLIYLTSLPLWILLTVELPTLVGKQGLPLWLVLEPPLCIGWILLGLNMMSAYLSRSDFNTNPFSKRVYRFESERITFLQKYGSVTVLPAAVAAAFARASSSAPNPLLLTFLGASVTAGAIGIVPIWVSSDDWRPLTILRHIKTVMLVWSVTWLVEAITILLA